MASWKAGAWDDDGDGWEDVASAPDAPVIAARVGKAPIHVVPETVTDKSETNLTGAFEPTTTKDDSMAHASDGKACTDTMSLSVKAPNVASQLEDRGDQSNSHQRGLDNDSTALQAALAASERRVIALTRERDNLRRVRDSRTSNIENAKDKDKQIAAVLEEGKQLSVKIAEKENALRNVKAALKEKDAELESLNISCSATEAKLEALVAKNRTLETSEKAALDGKEAAERRLRQMESDLRTKSASSAALDAARSQLESLRKSNTAALENQAMRLRAEADAELEKARDTAREENLELHKAIAELRLHLKQVSENAGWKEDQLRKEIIELRARAESLEARNEELAEAVPGATRPLLRQVEALQAAASERMRAVSAVERSQLSRLQAAEAAVAAGKERERAAEARIGSLLARIASLEEQVKIANSETARLASELRDAHGNAAETELAHQRSLDEAQVNAMKLVREKEASVDELSKARSAHLDEAEAAEEREKTLRDKIAALEGKLYEFFARSDVAGDSSDFRRFTAAASPAASVASSLQSPRTYAGTADTNSDSRAEDDINSSVSKDNIAVSNAGRGVRPGFAATASVTSFVESSLPGGLYDTERLQVALRQRTGEIEYLQTQLTSKESATQALADEVVALTARMDELSADVECTPQLRKDFEELRRRHSTLLELLGEREERIQELEADLSDVNQMYKEQITELLLKLES